MIGSQKYREDAKKSHTGVLVNMSARVGSISDNGLGGWYSYRMSKGTRQTYKTEVLPAVARGWGVRL